jgi:hypothetical protein
MELYLQKTESDSRYEVYFNKQHLGYFYMEVDGFYVFIPKGHNGYWNEFSLRILADKLEELNDSQHKKIELYFKNQQL